MPGEKEPLRGSRKRRHPARMLASLFRRITNGANAWRAGRISSTDSVEVPLDEFGVPLEWRLDEIDLVLLKASEEYWPGFETWAVNRGYKPFPPSPETALRFLCEHWDRGEWLYSTWRAIELRSDAYYWHSNTNPVYLLKGFRGIKVERDGTIAPLSNEPNPE